MLNFLKNYDFFGQEVNFNIANKNKFQTAMGGCCYFSIWIVFSWQIAIGFINYLYKLDPVLMITESTNMEPIIFKEKETIFYLRGVDHANKYGGMKNKTYDLSEYFDIIARKILYHEKNKPTFENLSHFIKSNGKESTPPKKKVLFLLKLVILLIKVISNVK